MGLQETMFLLLTVREIFINLQLKDRFLPRLKREQNCLPSSVYLKRTESIGRPIIVKEFLFLLILCSR